MDCSKCLISCFVSKSIGFIFPIKEGFLHALYSYLDFIHVFWLIVIYFCCGLHSARTDTTWVANELLDLSFSLEEDR